MRKLNKERRVAGFIGADQKKHTLARQQTSVMHLSGDEHSTPGEASGIAQGWEPGSVPGPLKETEAGVARME